jgi:hypothetical protein
LHPITQEQSRGRFLYLNSVTVLKVISILSSLRMHIAIAGNV